MTVHSDIDKLFKEGLSEYSQRPPGFVWDNIEQELNKRRFKKRRNIMYAMAASVALLLSFGAGYMFTTNNNENTFVAEVSGSETINVNPVDNNENLLTGANTLNQSEEKKNEVKENQEVIKESIENKDGQNIPVNPNKITKKKTEKPITKKVNSEGVLLPPMFASGETFQNSSLVDIATDNFMNDRESLELIEKQKFNLAVALEERDLKYEFREVPMHTNYNADELKEKDYSSWSVGINASPLISYRDVKSVQEESLILADVTSNYENQYQNEKPLVSYSAGIDVNYNVTKRFKIQSGVYFSEIGQISENVNLYKNQTYSNSGEQFYAVNTSTGNVNIQGSQNELIDRFGAPQETNNVYGKIPGSNNLTENSSPDLQTDFVQTFEFYEIPIVFSYKFIDRKLGMSMSGGVSANVLYGNNSYVQEDGKRYSLDAESENINSMTYNGIIGLGLDYPIFTRLFFNLQPIFKYALSPLNENGSVYPYSFGVYTGLRYNF